MAVLYKATRVLWSKRVVFGGEERVFFAPGEPLLCPR